jgi:hypothetical protein
MDELCPPLALLTNLGVPQDITCEYDSGSSLGVLIVVAFVSDYLNIFAGAGASSLDFKSAIIFYFAVRPPLLVS